MHKVEVFYVLCLFLTGKHKSIVSWFNIYMYFCFRIYYFLLFAFVYACMFYVFKVQKKLSDLKLIPGMCALFDEMAWLNKESERL